MAKRITIIGDTGLSALPGVQIKIEDTTAQIFSIYDKGDLRRTIVGNNLTLTRKEDSIVIIDNVLFSDIQNGNNSNAPFASIAELNSYILTNFFRKATSDGGGAATTDASQLTSGILPDARLSTNNAFKSDLDAMSVLSNPNWTATAASTLRLPLIGGRERSNRIIGKVTLAHLATKADTSQSALASLSDVFSNDALYGTNVLQWVSVAGTALTLGPSAVNAVPANVTNGLIRFTYMPVLNVNTYLDRFSLELHSAGTPASPTANYHAIDGINSVSDFKMRLTSLTAQGRFQSWNIPASMFTAVGTGADLTNILFARVVMRSSGGSITINIGNIELIPNKLTKAKCVINFDDGYQSQSTVASPLLAKYGFPATMYPGAIASFLDINASFVTSKMLKNMQNNLGWHIALQAYNTEVQATVDALTDAQQTAMMTDINKLYKVFGLVHGGHGSYYSGVGPTDPNVRLAFERMNTTMRTFNSGNSSGNPFIYPETYPFGDNHLVKSLNGATSAWGANTGAQLKLHIDQAILHKGVAFITFHDDIKTASSNAKDGFIALLAYLDSLRSQIDTVTMDDVFNIL